MTDRVSRFRVARLSLFPSVLETGPARYALIANTIRNGVPHGRILADGVVPGVSTYPGLEELLDAFDHALRQHRLS